MKIVFYINTLGKGGAERVLATLANHLSLRHQVTVVNSFKNPKGEYALADNVRHLYIDNNSFRTRFAKNRKRIHFLRQLFKKERPDVAISFMGEPNFRLIASTRFMRIKTIISVRNDPKKEYSGRLGRFIAKHWLVLSDGCVFQTEDAKLFFTKKLVRKSIVIPNPVNNSFFNTSFSGQRHDIVTCGRLTKQKNHKLLIKCFSRIKDLCEDNLIIYGDGPLKQELLTYASDNGVADRVVFAGQIDNVAEAIKGSKMFVLSSDYEGMPNALMEAMSLGLACISTNCPCGGPKSIITNGENGLLIEVGNERQLASAMEKLLLDSKFRDLLGFNAREIARNNFDSEKICSVWENYILKIVSES